MLQDLEQRVTSERLALYDKAWREGLRLQRNNQQINQRIYRLIIDFEEEETAYLWERMQAREQVRRSSLVILGSVAAGSLLVMLLFVGILWRDVNRSNRYKRQLEAANRHNEALLEAREKLMLTITHDIKAPLGSIMVYIDLLTRLDLGKRGALYLDHMKSSADHLLELVTDLLDFYKLDSNKVAVNRIAFSPADLFTAVCTGFEPVAAAKGIELRCTLAAELSGQVAGDPRVCGRSPRTCFPTRSSSPTGVRRVRRLVGRGAAAVPCQRYGSGNRPRGAGAHLSGVRAPAVGGRRERRRAGPLDRRSPREAARRYDRAGE